MNLLESYSHEYLHHFTVLFDWKQQISFFFLDGSDQSSCGNRVYLMKSLSKTWPGHSGVLNQRQLRLKFPKLKEGECTAKSLKAGSTVCKFNMLFFGNWNREVFISSILIYSQWLTGKALPQQMEQNFRTVHFRFHRFPPSDQSSLVETKPGLFMWIVQLFEGKCERRNSIGLQNYHIVHVVRMHSNLDLNQFVNLPQPAEWCIIMLLTLIHIC